MDQIPRPIVVAASTSHRLRTLGFEERADRCAKSKAA